MASRRLCSFSPQIQSRTDILAEQSHAMLKSLFSQWPSTTVSSFTLFRIHSVSYLFACTKVPDGTLRAVILFNTHAHATKKTNKTPSLCSILRWAMVPRAHRPYSCPPPLPQRRDFRCLPASPKQTPAERRRFIPIPQDQSRSAACRIYRKCDFSGSP